MQNFFKKITRKYQRIRDIFVPLTILLDPEIAKQDEEDSNELEIEEKEIKINLPTHSNDEFKPFMRKLPEYKFWEKTFLCNFHFNHFHIFSIIRFSSILANAFNLFFITFRFVNEKSNNSENFPEFKKSVPQIEEVNPQQNPYSTNFSENTPNSFTPLNPSNHPNQTIRPLTPSVTSARTSLLYKKRQPNFSSFSSPNSPVQDKLNPQIKSKLK